MIRILIEESNRHNSVGLGRHRFIDCTDLPCPCIQVSRPVMIKIVRSGTGLQAQGFTTIDQPCPTIMAGGLGGAIVPSTGLKMIKNK